MAISKDKKQALVAEMSELFASAKAIAVAKYQGTSVAELQELRKAARENGVVVKVVKNRLVRVAFAASETFKETDTSAMQGQLIYAVSSDDEVMAAKVLNDSAARAWPRVPPMWWRWLACRARISSSPRLWHNCSVRYTTLPTRFLAICMHCWTAWQTKQPLKQPI